MVGCPQRPAIQRTADDASLRNNWRFVNRRPLYLHCARRSDSRWGSIIGVLAIELYLTVWGALVGYFVEAGVLIATSRARSRGVYSRSDAAARWICLPLVILGSLPAAGVVCLIPLFSCPALFIGGLILSVSVHDDFRMRHEPWCRKCGYNLAGSASDRCPECGSPVATKTTVARVK